MCDRRIAKLGVVLLLVVIVVAARPSGEQAAGRVALVVGNSTYAHVGRLPNPGNDAEDVSAALRRLGFEVTTVRDAGRVELNDALRAFTRESAGVDVSLVFYAGHGLEMDGVNYLVPVDARLERDTDVRYETVELDDVLASTDGAELRVVILDACRNNPLARSMQRTGASRSVSRGSFGNLDEALLGDETLVAYSAAAGTMAADGEGRNSPYTSALLAYLEQPLEIGMLFRAVRARVLEETDREQRPHEYASLLGDHYLHAAAPPPVVSVEELPPPVVPVEEPTRAEVVFWESIRESTAPADFEALLEMFPNGTFTRLARNRLVALRAPDPPRTADPPPVVPVEELTPPVVPVEELTRAEVVFWESIRESTAPADFEALLEVFPNGTFARLARNRLAALRAPDPPRTADPPSVVPVEELTPPVVPVEELTPPEVPVEELTRAEVVFWESIRESTAPADFEALLEVFPNGTFARLARNRLAALRAPDPPRTADPPSVVPVEELTPPVVPVEELTPPEVPVEELTRAEVVFWESIRESTAPADFEALLEVFPNGTFARLARNRLAALRAPDPPRTDPSPDPPRRAGEVFRDCDGCPEMVVLPGGDLALGQYEVTVGEYRAFASVTGGGAGGGCSTRVNSDSWHDPGFPQTDRHPVTCVSWDDAQEYVSWLSRTAGAAYRLPTEAEWDRAAAGSQAGCYRDRTGNRGTCPVGSYGSNAAGLSDMVGNLWEWTEDCWEGDCSRRVLRGGSWFYVAELQRPGARLWYITDSRYISVGFRVARTLD